MSTTLFIDANGSAVIPPALLQMLGLKPGERLQADVSPQGIALKPAADVVEPAKTEGIQLIRKGKRLVAVGAEPFGAVEAIAAARDERDEMLLAYRNKDS
jgi:bifunctional DNA-binding transcriptional regulator/antitoxin component of YhaV-PrlF toxin-antitoxin module